MGIRFSYFVVHLFLTFSLLADTVYEQAFWGGSERECEEIFNTMAGTGMIYRSRERPSRQNNSSGGGYIHVPIDPRDLDQEERRLYFLTEAFEPSLGPKISGSNFIEIELNEMNQAGKKTDLTQATIDSMPLWHEGMNSIPKWGCWTTRKDVLQILKDMGKVNVTLTDHRKRRLVGHAARLANALNSFKSNGGKITRQSLLVPWAEIKGVQKDHYREADLPSSFVLVVEINDPGSQRERKIFLGGVRPDVE